MRKRKSSSSSSLEEASEMDIEGEAKICDQEVIPPEEDGDDDDDEDMVIAKNTKREHPDDHDGDDDSDDDGGDDDDDDDDGESCNRLKEAIRSTRPVENPFMDSFYSLSSSSPQERSQAAQMMLHHCLLGPTANAKDSTYAFRRLLNGLCSGRAAARQGNASTLASFLKIVYRENKIKEIRIEASGRAKHDKTAKDGVSDLMYIRERLLSATDPIQIVGKKKGSEERDYQFGRLFGILAIVRSNILVANRAVDVEDAKEVTKELISDLVALFWLKKWMREPAAHGIVTMLKVLLDGDNDTCGIALGLVNDVVVPKLLIITQDSGHEAISDRQKLLEGFCAEQIGIAAYIQSHPRVLDLPFPLDQPMVTTLSVPWMGGSLSETASVVHPRIHFVWDALWCFLTEEDERHDKSLKSSKKFVTRKLRDKIPGADESAQQVLKSILDIVVKEKLLRMEDELSTKKATHERRSLALSIVRNLCGAPFLSSICGQIQIVIDDDSLQNVVLTEDIVRALFINVIAGGKHKQSSSLLKPMALDVLRSICAAAVETGGNRPLSCVKAFLNCDVRFDAKTKTTTIADMMGFNNDNIPSEADLSLWNHYLEYLQTQFLSLCRDSGSPDSIAEAIAFAELIYCTAKSFLRVGGDLEQAMSVHSKEYKGQTVKRILNLFLVTAFFDLTGLKRPKTGKKKKKKHSNSMAMDVAFTVKEAMNDITAIPYNVRSIVAARFFSLTSEFSMVAARESKDDEHRTEKDTNTLAVLSELCDGWKDLENNGAKRFHTNSDVNGDDDSELPDPESAVRALRDHVVSWKQSAVLDSDESLMKARVRCSTGMAVLGLTLYLHRLQLGFKNSMEEDADETADEEDDDDDNEEQICSALEELKSVVDDFFGEGSSDDSNPLLGLTESCANILSSPIGSGSIGRVSSPKLVREAVRYAWLGGLRMASCLSTKEKTLLDSSVIDVLMEAVGCKERESDAQEDEGSEDDSVLDSDQDDGTDQSVDDGIFVEASTVLEEIEEFEDPKTALSNEDESEVEIDSSKLQHMLEEDSDADVDEKELEHHEGADGALAKFIKLKQDARKEGQRVREKMEVSNQLRCTLLLEVLLSRPDAWNRLFRSNLLEMVMPLLQRRKQVAGMVEKALEGGSRTGAGEKKALLERLTGLIKQRLCKLRLLSMPLATYADVESSADLIKMIIKDAKKAKDKEHVACCSSALIFVLRAMPCTEEVVTIVATEYGQIVDEWSTKRSRGASIIEDLINQMPKMATATLLAPLNDAARKSRSPFLRIEAFRLLSLLFSLRCSSGQDSTDLEKLAQASFDRLQLDLLETMFISLKDDELSNSKGARVVMKALEKLLPCLSGSPAAAPEVVECLAKLKVLIEERERKENGKKGNGMATSSSRLVRLIDQRLDEMKATVMLAESTDLVEDPAETVTSANKTKKSKKKKKKNKR